MSKGSGLVGKIGAALRNLGLKAPWQITGPTSSPEYLSHLPKAVEYRIHAPTSQGRVTIPHALPERVYDIKYYTRDSRRAHLPGGTTTMVKEAVDPRAAGETPLTPGQPVTWKGDYKNILDNDHNGYTM